LIRPLNSFELSPALTTATTNATNVGLSTVATGSTGAGVLPASVTFSSLTLNSGGGVNLAILPRQPVGAPNGGLLTLTPANAEGLLALSGNTGIFAGNYGAASTSQHHPGCRGTGSLTIQCPARDEHRL